VNHQCLTVGTTYVLTVAHGKMVRSLWVMAVNLDTTPNMKNCMDFLLLSTSL